MVSRKVSQNSHALATFIVRGGIELRFSGEERPIDTMRKRVVPSRKEGKGWCS